MYTFANDCRIVLVTKFDRKTRVYSNVHCAHMHSDAGLYEIVYQDDNLTEYQDFYNIRDVAKLSITPKNIMKVAKNDDSTDSGCDREDNEV